MATTRELFRAPPLRTTALDMWFSFAQNWFFHKHVWRTNKKNSQKKLLFCILIWNMRTSYYYWPTMAKIGFWEYFAKWTKLNFYAQQYWMSTPHIFNFILCRRWISPTWIKYKHFIYFLITFFWDFLNILNLLRVIIAKTSRYSNLKEEEI